MPDPNNTTTPPTQPDYPVAVAEQVCNGQGNLGLVLPIRPPVFSGQTVDQLYPNTPCLSGNLIFGAAPKIPGTSSSTLCPNGDVTSATMPVTTIPRPASSSPARTPCLIPASSANDARCINGSNNFNPPLDPPPAGRIPGNRRDGRVFNLHQYNSSVATVWTRARSAVRSVVGNFSRIHTTAHVDCRGAQLPRRWWRQALLLARRRDLAKWLLDRGGSMLVRLRRWRSFGAGVDHHRWYSTGVRRFDQQHQVRPVVHRDREVPAFAQGVLQHARRLRDRERSRTGVGQVLRWWRHRVRELACGEEPDTPCPRARCAGTSRTKVARPTTRPATPARNNPVGIPQNH